MGDERHALVFDDAGRIALEMISLNAAQRYTVRSDAENLVIYWESGGKAWRQCAGLIKGVMLATFADLSKDSPYRT